MRRAAPFAFFALSALLGACESAESAVTAVDVSASDSAASDAAGAEVGQTDTGPSAPPVEVERGTASGGGSSRLIVVDQLIFPEVSDDQTQAIGFDLDGVVSDESDSGSCGKKDLVSPEDGQVGIDNQLATVVPLMELVGLGAFQTLVQRAIEEGGLLIVFELTGIDDLQNDADVTLTLRVGEGVPLLGTDGRLLSGQTFHEKPGSKRLTASARIDDGVLTAEGFDTVVPIVVFGVPYELGMNGARFRARLTEDGGLADGMLGGAVPMADILAIAEKGAMNDGSILPAVQSLMTGIADLAPDKDGECTALSAAIQITGVSAFLYEDHFEK